MSGARIAAVILAAGCSSRMGRAKALLEFQGEPLVARVARAAADAGLEPVIVVAGAERAAIAEAVTTTGALVVENRGWTEGLASSIRRGIETLTRDCDAAVLLLADQPLVTCEHLRELTAAYAAGNDPVATRYGDRRGVPALFGSRWFPELASLAGDRGARDILEREQAYAIGEGAPFDVDTPEDYERLLRR